MSAEVAIQRMLHEVISDLGYTVHDVLPQRADPGADAGWPNVSIGEVVLAAWDDKTTNGFDFVARIHSRSRSAGVREVKEMQGAIYAALHNATPPVQGFATVLLRRETSDVTRVADGSFHGVCEYRGLIYQT